MADSVPSAIRTTNVQLMSSPARSPPPLVSTQEIVDPEMSGGTTSACAEAAGQAATTASAAPRRRPRSLKDRTFDSLVTNSLSSASRGATLTGPGRRKQASRYRVPNGEPVSLTGGVVVGVVVVPPVVPSPPPSELDGVLMILNVIWLRPNSSGSRLPAPSTATTSSEY